jgi:osmoprotectant transport system ATP-binding protein
VGTLPQLPERGAVASHHGAGLQPGAGMLQLQSVCKSYDGRVVLHALDLEVPAGRSMALVGPSGCGKSTLLRLMLGLITPDSGAVLFRGQPMNGQNVHQLRHEFGYVIQNGGLFPHLTARQNVCLLAGHLSWSLQKQDARVEQLRQLTHLPDEALERFPGQLSGGQQQRVALMRALMLDPQVLLLDEPLGALDPLIRVELRNDLREIFSLLHKTVVVVTHDLGEAAALGDEIAVMRAGRLVQRGSFRQLLEAPADPFVTQFINAARSPLDEVVP